MTFIYPHDAVAKFTLLFDIYYMLTSNNPFLFLDTLLSRVKFLLLVYMYEDMMPVCMVRHKNAQIIDNLYMAQHTFSHSI